jgi:polar amino acid transport system permease protein
MNANLAVIADNLDYLLWGRLADGIPGGVALTLLMAIGAAALALPSAGWQAPPGVTAGWCASAVPVGGAYSRHSAYSSFLAVVSAADADRERSAGAVTVTLALAWFTAASVMHSVLAGCSRCRRAV